MESVPQSGVTEEVKMSEMVELIMETTAEVGATGFRVAGGGKEGIFVKEVLKESKAAKALNLKEGDQLLSAKVYFDNAKYEDVMKILQSAEPYKVAFCLKRTVPSADVAISAETGSLELKGPEAKKTKLSVKSMSPIKKTKKLMKGKVLSRDEAGVELDVPVDVEFAFPKFSTFKKLTITSPKDAAASKGEGRVTHPEVEAELSLGEEQAKDKKKKLKFPGLRGWESGKAKVDVGTKPPEPKGTVSVRPPQVTAKGAGVKANTKEPTPDRLPKAKKEKVDVPVSKAKTELAVSGGAEGEAAEGKLALSIPAKAPKVEIDIGLTKAEPDVKGPAVEGDLNAKGFKLKMPSFAPKDGEAAERTGPKVKVEGQEAVGEVEGPEGKLKMPQISIPSIDISVPKMKESEEVDVTPRGVEIAVGSYRTEGLEGRVKELAQKITTIDISAPKVSDFEISLPKGKADVSGAGLDVKAPDIRAAKVEGEIQKSKVSIEGPEVKLKVPKVSLPEFSISTKGKEDQEIEGEGPDAKGSMLKMPKFEVSLPKMKLGEADAAGSPPKTEARVQVSKAKMDIKGPQLEGPEAKIKLPSVKMPTIDITAPKVTIPDVQLPARKVEVSSPGIDLKTSKVSAGAPRADGRKPDVPSEGFDLQLKMPKVSLPMFDISASGKEAEAKADAKLEAGGEDAKFKGMKIPKFEVALPKIKLAEDEAELAAEADVSGPGLGIMAKLPSVKMPTIDISAPEIKIPDVHLPAGKAEVPPPAVEGGIKIPKVSIGAPKVGSQPSEVSPEALTLQLKMPKVALPTFGTSASGKEAAGEVRGPEVDTKGKLPSVKMPTLDISAPEIKLPEMDVNICHPKEKAAVGDVAAKGEGKGLSASVKSPKTGGEEQRAGVTLTGPDVTLQMPKVSLPKFDISMKSKEAGDVRAGKGLEAEDTDGKAKLKMPQFEVALPKLKVGEVDVSDPTTEAAIKTGKRDTKGKADVEEDESSKLKLKMPSMKMPTIDIPALQTEFLDIDISLPSIKSTSAAEGDAKVESGGRPAGVSVEGPDAKVKMPKISLPKFGSKSKEGDSNGAKVDGKTPSPAAKGKVQGKALDTKGPSVDADVDDPKLKGKEGKLKMPKFKMPTFGTSKKYEEGIDISIPSPDIGKHIPKGKVEVTGPGLKAESPEGKEKATFMKSTKFGISAFKSKSLEAEVSLPHLAKGKPEGKDPGAGTKKTDISTKADLTIEGPDIQLKMPSFTMPTVGIFGPKAEADLDAEAKTKSGTLDAEGSGSKLKMPSIQMPSIEISVPQVKPADTEGLLPRTEVDVSEVELKSYGGELKIPKGKGKTGAPDPEEKQKLPSVKMPSVDISVPKVKAPDVDLSFSVPKVDTSVQRAEGKATLLSSEPQDLELKLKMPKFGLLGSKEKEADVSASAEDAEGRGVTFKGKMPKVDISLPKVKQSEVDVEMDASLLEAEGPDTDGKFKLPTFSLPKFSPPKIVAPDINLDITLSKDRKLARESSDPKAEPHPAGGEFKIKMPQVSLPSFGASAAEAKDIELDARLPTDKSKAKSKAEIKGPQVELESPGEKIKGGKIKMPKFQISTKVKAEGEAAETKEETEGGKLKLRLPKFGTLPKSSEVEAGVELEGSDGKGKASKSKTSVLGISLGKGRKGEVDPSTGVSGPVEGDLEANGSRKSEKFKIKMPSVTIPTPKVDIDIDRSSPKGKAASTDREARIDVKGTKGAQVKGELQAPNASVDSSESWFKMPKLTMPDFNISDSGGKDPSATVETKVKVSETSVRRSKAEVDVQGPEVDMDGKFQMLMAKMPKVEIDLPKDDSFGEGKVEGKAGVDVQQAGKGGTSSEEIFSTGFFKMPTVEISTPKIGESSVGMEGGGAEMDLRSLEGRGGFQEAETDILQLKMPKIELPSFGSTESKDKSQEPSGDRSSTGATAGSSVSKAKTEVRGPQVSIKGLQVESNTTGTELDGSEGRLSKLKEKMSKVGVELPKVSAQEETAGVVKGEGSAKGRDVSYTSLKADIELTGPEAKLKTDKSGKQLFGFPKTSSPKDKGHSKSGTPPEADSSEVKLKTSKVKMPSFGISWSKNKTSELNGSLEAETSARKGEDWEIRRKKAGAEESDDTDSLEGKSKLKLKLPKVKIPTVDVSLSGPGSSVTVKQGDSSGLHLNGESESQGVMGKIKLPKVEFSSPYQKAKDGDNEQSLQLVKTEMSLSKDDATPQSGSDQSFKTSSPRVNGGAVRGGKVKGPKITLSGFRKKGQQRAQENEDTEASKLVTSTARTELALLESGGDAGHTKTGKSKTVGFTSGKFKGTYSVHGATTALADSGKGHGREREESETKSAKFKIPKFSLGPKSKGVLELSSAEYQNNIVSELQLEDAESATRHFKFQVPRIGFTTVYHEEHSSEEKVVDGQGSLTGSKGRKQAKTETLTDKPTSI